MITCEGAARCAAIQEALVVDLIQLILLIVVIAVAITYFLDLWAGRLGRWP